MTLMVGHGQALSVPPPSPALGRLQRTVSQLDRLQQSAAACMLHCRRTGDRSEAQLVELFRQHGKVKKVHLRRKAGGRKNWALVTFADHAGFLAALAAAPSLEASAGIIVSKMDMHRALLSTGSMSDVIDTVADDLQQMHERVEHHHRELERVHSSMRAIRAEEYIPPRYTRKHHIWAEHLQAHLRGWRARRWAKMMHLRGSDYPTLRLKQQTLCTEDEVAALRQTIMDFTAPAPPSSLASIEFSDLFSDEEADGGDGGVAIATIGLDFADPSNALGPVGLRWLVSCLETDGEGLVNGCQINLMSLDVSGSHITGSIGNSSLASDLDRDLSGLRALCNCRCFAGSGVMLHGRPACTLGRLCLSSTGLGFEGLDLLLSTVGRSLSVLELGRNPFSDRGVKRLAEVLGGSHALEELRLPGCALGPSAAAALAQLLCHPEGSRLRVLDVADNWLAGLDFAARGAPDASGLAALGNALASMGGSSGDEAVASTPSLTEVNLRRNSLTASAARALAPGLSACVGLRRLDLSYNRLGDCGVAELAPALQKLASGTPDGVVNQQQPQHQAGLYTLNLAHNWLYARSAMLLADALHGASVLHELELSDNFLGGDTLDAEPTALGALAKTVQWLASSDGGQLRCLGVRGCRIGAACARALSVGLLSATANSASPAAAAVGGAAADTAAEEDSEQDEEVVKHGLTELDLSSNWLLCSAAEHCTFGLSDDERDASQLGGWRALCGGLRLSLVVHCALVDCQLSASAATILADNMGGWSALRSLDLSRNPLGDDGVAALCGRLHVSVTQARGLSPQGVSYQADGSRAGTASTSLVLQCDQRSQIARSSIAYHTLSPRWEENFTFLGLGDSTDLQLTVVHWDDEGKTVELGSVALLDISDAATSIRPSAQQQEAGDVTTSHHSMTQRWYPFFVPDHHHHHHQHQQQQQGISSTQADAKVASLSLGTTEVGMLSHPDGEPQHCQLHSDDFFSAKNLREREPKQQPKPVQQMGFQQQFEVQCGLRFVHSSLLRDTTSLHTLRLCNCSLGPRAAKALSRSIGPNLRRLELDHNLLSGSVLEPLAGPNTVSANTHNVVAQQCGTDGERPANTDVLEQACNEEDVEEEDDDEDLLGFVMNDEEERTMRGLRAERRRRQRMQRDHQTSRVDVWQPQPLSMTSPTHHWCRDRDLSGLILLVRRFREQHADSGQMMQLTAGWNEFGGAAEALLRQFLRSGAQALPTMSWLERRRRDRAAAAGTEVEGVAAAGGGPISLPAGGEWQSSGELSTVQSNVWRGPTAVGYDGQASVNVP